MADEPVNTGGKQGGKFEPGKSGNPKGRPKGSRNKLGEDFIAALHQDFQENGKEAIESVRTDKPDAYLKVIASIVPKELNIKVEDDLSDAELDQRIRQLASALSLEVGTGGTSSDKAEEAAAESTGGISSVH